MNTSDRLKSRSSGFKSKLQLGVIMIVIASLFQPAASAISPSKIKITVHYQRAASDYTDWDLWMWRFPWNGDDPNVDSKGVKFTEADKFGKIAIVSVDGLDKYTSIAFIVRRGGDGWLEKDITEDRYIEKFASDGTAEIWLIQGDTTVYYQDPAVAKAAADKAAADKAAADKAAADKAAADKAAAAKAAAAKAAAAKAAAAKAAAAKKTTITCVKGKLIKTVTAVNPKCPTGYKKK
jgi:hypothetical protein